MKHSPPMIATLIALTCASSLLTGCGGGGGTDVSPTAVDKPVAVTVTGPNAVSQWNEIATNTINQPAAATGTEAERSPEWNADLATLHVAIYDAVVAIAGTYRPYAITPTSPTAGASQEAAVASAAYQVLLGLYPSRSAVYQAAYDSAIAKLPDEPGKTLGITIGAQVAAGILALRAHDGRAVTLAPYVPGTAPGDFRSSFTIGRELPFIKPFVLTGNAQFRAPGPQALTSAAYAADVNETESLGSATSTTRTAAQTDTALFNTELPTTFFPRNLRVFAMTNRSLLEQARLMAMLWVAQNDAVDACFESKYVYNFWRPISAITLADTDGNAATTADPSWTPLAETPPHPEYPSGHACLASAAAEILRFYYDTPNVSFDWTGTVTNNTHHFATVQAMVDDMAIARIAVGWHFRSSVNDGNLLGKNVADWIATHAFQPK